MTDKDLNLLQSAIKTVTEPVKPKSISDDPKHYIVFATKDSMEIDGKKVSMIDMWKRISGFLGVKNAKAMAKAISLLFVDYQKRLAIAEAERHKKEKTTTE